MRAASVCVVRDIPFTFNTVLTAQNRDEVCEIVELGCEAWQQEACALAI